MLNEDVQIVVMQLYKWKQLYDVDKSFTIDQLESSSLYTVTDLLPSLR